jgi:hypothetical protein
MLKSGARGLVPEKTKATGPINKTMPKDTIADAT